MGLAARRKNQKAGEYSRVMIIPAELKVGEESSIAAGRLMLADPRGEIDEEELLEFLEEKIEPVFWKWREENSDSEFQL